MGLSLKIQLLEKSRIKDTFNPKPNYVDIVKLIRSIQRAEGHIDCYRQGETHCNRMDCNWRDHCLVVPGGKSPHHKGLKNENKCREKSL
jgi:hypothetical protein